jgi:predicted nucleic acid-binding protein
MSLESRCAAQKLIMNIFCDTSVLVASALRSHEHYSRAFDVVERVADKKDHGVVALHSLAETYAVLTRLPVIPRIQPDEAAKIVSDNIVRHFHMQQPSARDYLASISAAAANGVIGGAIYDVLLLAAARKLKPDRIYTFNVAEFRRLAPDLHDLIIAP